MLPSWVFLVFLSDGGEPNKILVDGVMRLLDDLDLPPDSRLVLILAWKLRAATQCEFTRDEFMNGFTELGFVSIQLCFVVPVMLLFYFLEVTFYIQSWKCVLMHGLV